MEREMGFLRGRIRTTNLSRHDYMHVTKWTEVDEETLKLSRLFIEL